MVLHDTGEGFVQDGVPVDEDNQLSASDCYGSRGMGYSDRFLDQGMVADIAGRPVADVFGAGAPFILEIIPDDGD